jgi:glycerophosphoryl diester phosphodiesterase
VNARPEPEIIAHRGFSARAPENTLSAFEAAIEVGAESIELDVQTAACGTPVVFHDLMLGRTTNGVGPVQRRSLVQLKALDAGSWFGDNFIGETVPTLAQALSCLSGRVYRVYLDIKGYRELEDLDRIVSLTREKGLEGAAVFTSPDWVVMNHFRKTAPEIQRAYLVAESQNLGEALDRAVVDGGAILNAEVGVILQNPDKLDEARGLGLEIMAWTIDREGDAQVALGAGVSRIVTNEVQKLLGWRIGLG